MRIASISYTEFQGQPNEWGFKDFQIGQTNLIVGKNAYGKTRILNVIGNFANLICGEKKDLGWGCFDVSFDKLGKKINYFLDLANNQVVAEKFTINDKIFLDRSKNRIFAQQLNKDIEFQAPEKDLVCVTRRDSIQHPYFEDLFEWGKSLRHFYFGTPLGRDTYIALEEGPEGSKVSTTQAINPKNTAEVVSVLRDGIDKFPKIFQSKIIEDMEMIGYEIEEIEVAPFPIAHTNLPSTKVVGILGILIKEKDMDYKVPQSAISQGMFRALSLIVHINYSVLTAAPDCILIDDIGEGLDYQRSTALIKLLIEKVSSSNIQLIMSTNDRFIMNNVPLEYWCVLQRQKQGPKILTHRNSKEIFEKFELTGLSNFDFFSTQYYDSGDN